MTILVLSPHLDDAALSCADHIRAWRKAGHHVRVVTLFSSFGSSAPSAYMQHYISDQGFETMETYTAARHAEDREAMRLLEVEYSLAGACDASFRSGGNGLLYPDYRWLTRPGNLAQETPVLESVKAHLEELPTPELAVSPMGIGSHVDHLIAREACQSVWSGRAGIGFYFDFPYARNPKKYSLSALRLTRGRRLSVKLLSRWKRAVIACYRTQVRYMFRLRPVYPEILFLPRQFPRAT